MQNMDTAKRKHIMVLWLKLVTEKPEIKKKKKKLKKKKKNCQEGSTNQK